MVIVEGVTKNRSPKLQKEVLETLDKKIPEHSIIVFWEETAADSKKSKAPAGRSKPLHTRLKKEKFAQEFSLLSPGEVYQFIAAETAARGGKISSGAGRLLADIVGNDLWQANSEINKLIAFARGAEITETEVSALVKTKLDEDIFKLTDALGQKNKKLALKLISDQLQSGAAPTELLSKVTWQFRNLLMVKSFVEQNGSGYGDSGMAYQLGLHPFVARKTLGQANGYELETLKKIYNYLVNFDFKLKTSQAEPEVLFDLLVVKS